MIAYAGYVNTLLLCFNSINRHRKLVDVLEMSHLSFQIFFFFFYVDSKSMIVHLVRFDTKFVTVMTDA